MLAVADAWCGITIAYYTDWPASFCIAVLSTVGYFVSLGLSAPQATPVWKQRSCVHKPIIRSFTK